MTHYKTNSSAQLSFVADIDEVQFTSKPSQPELAQLRGRQKGRQAQYVTLDTLAGAVSHGQTIVPADLNGGVSNTDWIKQQLFMVDIDNKEAIITPKMALEKCKEINILPCLIYSTLNNSPQIPKYRICFCCAQEITEEADRQLIQDTLTGLFCTADQACRNSARIFYGSTAGCVKYKREVTFTLEAIKEIAKKQNPISNVPEQTTQTVDSEKEARRQELKQLIAQYPIVDYFKDNSWGQYDPQTGFVNPCPICGHNNDFHIDTKQNIFKCFGENGGLGGNIITWLTKGENLSMKQAICKLKYDLLKLPRPEKEPTNEVQPVVPALTEETYVKKYRAFDKLYNFYNGIQNGVSTPPIATGFKDLDEALDGGIRPEQLIVIGAISSLGKTTFVLQASDYIAQTEQDVLIFSLEMSESELMAKSISRQTFISCGINANDLQLAKTSIGITSTDRWKNYSEAEKEHINNAVEKYSESAKHIYISEGYGNITVDNIRKQVEEHITLTKKKPVVVIDYLQIIAPHSVRASDKQATDYAVTSLKKMARDLKVPVIAISSFNRMNYGSSAKMSAFKESGSIEYSADILMTLTLQNASNEAETTKAKAVSNDVRTPRSIELTILKNRSGKTGNTIPYYFFSAFNTFAEGSSLPTLKSITTSGTLSNGLTPEETKALTDSLESIDDDDELLEGMILAEDDYIDDITLD